MAQTIFITWNEVIGIESMFSLYPAIKSGHDQSTKPGISRGCLATCAKSNHSGPGHESFGIVQITCSRRLGVATQEARGMISLIFTGAAVSERIHPGHRFGQSHISGESMATRQDTQRS